MYKYIHTYIYIYVHTYIHTYIHTSFLPSHSASGRSVPRHRWAPGTVAQGHCQNWPPSLGGALRRSGLSCHGRWGRSAPTPLEKALVSSLWSMAIEWDEQ